MKKVYISIILLFFLLLQLACSISGLQPNPENNSGQLETYVAGTMAALNQEQNSPTAQSVVAEPVSLSLDDFPNRELLGEDDRFMVFLKEKGADDSMEKSGEIFVLQKSNNRLIEVDGSFSLMGSVQVYSDESAAYLLLSPGTYTLRQAIVINLSEKRQVVDEFCLSAGENGSHLFWKDYLIYNTCDRLDNRPWGAGEASGISAINLKTGVVTEIARSDLTHQYNVESVSADTLKYIETSVSGEEDWQNLANQKANTLSYDLMELP